MHDIPTYNALHVRSRTPKIKKTHKKYDTQTNYRICQKYDTKVEKNVNMCACVVVVVFTHIDNV